MTGKNEQLNSTCDRVGREHVDTKTTLEDAQQESMPNPETHPTHTLGEDGVSYRSSLDVLQTAADRLYDLELARISERNAVLRMWRLVDHPDRIPETLRQQVFLLLHL